MKQGCLPLPLPLLAEVGGVLLKQEECCLLLLAAAAAYTILHLVSAFICICSATYVLAPDSPLPPPARFAAAPRDIAGDAPKATTLATCLFA